jgi:hypothetical protein
MIFRLKKDFAPRATEPSAGTRSKDLSSGKMQFSALRYKLKDDPTIYKVKSVFATVEQILASNVKK